MMSANGLVHKILDRTGEKLTYYDSFAFVDINTDKMDSHSNYVSELYKTHYITKNYTKHRGEPPFKVKSAFCGCTIYEMSTIMDKRNYYTGEVCEHISFHFRMISNGYTGLYINPSLILLHSLYMSTKSATLFDRLIVARV